MDSVDELPLLEAALAKRETRQTSLPVQRCPMFTLPQTTMEAVNGTKSSKGVLRASMVVWGVNCLFTLFHVWCFFFCWGGVIVWLAEVAEKRPCK